MVGQSQTTMACVDEGGVGTSAVGTVLLEDRETYPTTTCAKVELDVKA